MSLIPESISSVATEAYDATFKARMDGLDLKRVVFNLRTETNPIRLQLHLDMYGIDGNLFGFLALTPAQRMILFSQLRTILMTSGSEWSICNMAMALGASNATISFGGSLYHDGTIIRNGTNHRNDTLYSQFAITVHVWGIDLVDQAEFEENYRRLWIDWQPARLYLVAVVFH